MRDALIIDVTRLSMPWQTLDPFLFCVHHEDAYPAGDARMAPAAPLTGRAIGHDFSGKDGWSMYHGDVVPGFPRHPHCGFETVTIARRGYIDHTDSLGAAARFGQGDAQWMTAGRGVVHSEMFPLVHQDRPNPTELFQIWLNLPRAGKRAQAHFAMLWSHTIPRHRFSDEAGRVTQVATIAGALDGVAPPAPPPDSWAADPASDLAIWTLKLEPGATWTLPPAQPGSNRALYLFAGAGTTIGGQAQTPGVRVRLRPDAAAPIVNGGAAAELLLLQGRPIGEPVVQHGPFVASTRGELQQAIVDYQRTGFGGWPWPSDSPAHPRERGRFARHADGRVEAPDEP